jgi:uncharacterized protein (DUF1697 family)
MATFVALLRSINVGGRNKVPMADLRVLVSSLGFGDVATYLQSGNLVFTGSGSVAGVAQKIEDALDAELGVAVPVIVRTAPQLNKLIGGNPYVDQADEPTTVHVSFLADVPSPQKVRELDELSGQFGDDRFEVIGSHVYLHCPGGYGETKLHNSFLERRLATTGTTRNWRTVTALGEMVRSA